MRCLDRNAQSHRSSCSLIYFLLSAFFTVFQKITIRKSARRVRRSHFELPAYFSFIRCSYLKQAFDFLQPKIWDIVFRTPIETKCKSQRKPYKERCRIIPIVPDLLNSPTRGTNETSHRNEVLQDWLAERLKVGVRVLSNGLWLITRQIVATSSNKSVQQNDRKS